MFYVRLKYHIMFQVGGALCCFRNACQSILIALLYPTISFELSDAGHPLNVNQLAVPCVNWLIMTHELDRSINHLQQ